MWIKIKNIISVWLLNHYISVFVRKKTPDRLSLSSEKSKHYDLYEVRFHPEEDKNYLLNDVAGNNEVSVFEWDDAGQKKNKQVHIKHLSTMQHQIIHYYKGHILEYDDIIKYAIDKTIMLRCIRIFISNIVNKTSLYLFYRKKLVIANRMKLLDMLIEDRISSGDNYQGKDKIAILSLHFNQHWILHPDKDRLMKTIQLYLESFISGGEVIVINNFNYKVTGKALETYTKYIQEEQRHQQAIKQQKNMIYLTIVISILTLFTTISALGQAGIIAFPTLINLKG
ncbi:hypothetical protein [Serratia marcescens]|uniref:hypothetical protein n=1 Tax=Serratia marcescens TaxID=615 RepID=UPI001F0675A4|nr:hypothetical protein [Serratia marcescens]MDM1836697.1 hypothetical protein [Serratia marcescens]MDM1846095.1 hypothetical protein [Serratia marcescens]UMK47458.1 hypothetical protein L2D51_20925 [Serratia marcescens]